MRGRRVFKIAGSRGDVYKTAASGCTCPAGVRGRGCYHMAAVRMLAA
jgi:uncharacterized Zn finger protein